MTNDALDFLVGATGAPAKFPAIGAKVTGKVLRYEKRQSRDMDNNLKYWDDGSPVYEAIITLATEERDPQIDDDDGMRRLFVRGQMLNAIRDALRKAGWRKDLVGGTLGVKYVSDGQATRRGFSPPKEYLALFEPPTQADEFDAMASDEPEPPIGEEPF